MLNQMYSMVPIMPITINHKKHERTKSKQY